MKRDKFFKLFLCIGAVIGVLFNFSADKAAALNRPIEGLEEERQSADFSGVYSGTWDKNISLCENQKNLVDMILDECTHRITDESTFDLGLGKFKTSPKHMEKVREVLNKIAQVPVGCELLRQIVTEYRLNPDTEKIYFVIPEDKKFSVHFAESISHKINEVSRLMIFSGDSRYSIPYASVLYSGDDEFLLSEVSLSVDEVFFHEMLHWLHSLRGDFRIGEFDILEDFIPSPLSPDYRDKLMKFTFGNDEEFRSMFGLVKKRGNFYLDPVNEGAYLYKNKKTFRISHATVVCENKKTSEFESALKKDFSKKEAEPPANPEELMFDKMAFDFKQTNLWKWIMRISDKYEFGKGNYEYKR